MIRTMLRRSALVAALLAAPAPWAPLAAADLTLPVPTAVIYPGDVIKDDLLIDRSFAIDPMLSGVISDRAALLGKIAHRTLLPGKPIPVNAVSDPKVVLVGAQVKLVFSEGGLTITTYGVSLQAASIGDIVKVRNPDSGIVITGTVQADGSVRVSDS